MDAFVEIVGSVLFILGMLLYFLKPFLHFSYIKIIKKYPDSMTLFSYLFDMDINVRKFMVVVEIVLPVLFSVNREKYTAEEVRKLKKLEKRIYFTIFMFVLGIVSMVVCLSVLG